MWEQPWFIRINPFGLTTAGLMRLFCIGKYTDVIGEVETCKFIFEMRIY